MLSVTLHHIVPVRNSLQELQYVSVMTSMTYIVSSNPPNGEVYSIQHYVMKFVSDLRQVGGFLPVLPFPPPIKLTTTI
jgi:hypothetical protein